ncbi:sporulation protein YqfD [Anaerosacchariphilus polymeriproducens]|uniref:Sporulation protein YqfD n=1 Tax=Anaerosacchariphilus polymeriproducens TaxID=1812858 RepID=A0A371AU44_9FIRM|nr:sporulation protein YqfD [Anaerosacchariphilus polymeriproducens]RDU23078.1 sporulation protein YqfD [Anaerosacchariphilus polymeriproducens]
MNHFVNYYKGYVKVRLISLAPERFFNMCSNHEIYIWNLKNHDDAYEFYIYRKDFLKLKNILRKSKSKIIILEKKGFPMFLFKNRKRKAFFCGIVIAFVFLTIMSMFIWDVEINGNVTETDNIIFDYLKEQSVCHGTLKSKIDCEKMEEKLRARFNDIIWASVQINGTRLIVSVQEGNARRIIDKKDKNVPMDLIAKKDGIIENIITRRGVPQVTKGSTVKKGDILVLGRIEILNDAKEVCDYQYCQSDSDIFGRTEYTYKDEFSLTYNKKVYTNKKKVSHSIRAFDYLLKIGAQKIPYKHYDFTANEKQLKLSTNFYLPFFLETNIYEEYKVVKNQYTKEQATKIEKLRLKRYCKNLIEKGVQIVENNVIIEVNKKSCIGNGEIIVIEPIGTYQETEILEVPKNTESEEGNLQ